MVSMHFKTIILATLAIALLVVVDDAEAIVKLLTTLIRDNVAGQPVIHQTQYWPFDPDEGPKRSVEFEAHNGRRSYYLIEKLGLGNDGRQDERKYQQMIRDLGVPTTSYDDLHQLMLVYRK